MLTLKLSLEAATVLLAAARATEQLANLRNDVTAGSKQDHQLAADSLFAPAASAAAVAYGHFIGANAILLVATWMNTIAGSFCWTLRRWVSTDKTRAASSTSAAPGDRP